MKRLLRARFGRRLAGFAGLPLLSAVSPLLVLPLLARFGGVSGWAAIGTGQSIGALASVLVVAGWSLHGPAAVAGADPAAQRVVYGDSFAGRLLLFAVVAPIAGTLAAVLSPPGSGLLAAMNAVVFAMSGLSPAWFCIGVGRPGLIALYEVAPRLAGVALSVVLLTATHDVLVYPVVVFCSTLAGILLFSFRFMRFGTGDSLDLRRAVARLWRDRYAALAVGTAGLYSTTPVALMSLVLNVEGVARFSSADRLFRIGLYAIIALGNALQGWVAEDSPREVSPRMRRALGAHLALGLAGGLGLAALAPLASMVLFGSRVAVEPATAVFYGIAYLCIAVNTSTGGQILVPLGESRAVFWSTTSGAVVGVVAMLVLASTVGAWGGSAGLALGEAVVCLVQAGALLSRMRLPSASLAR